MRAIAILLMVGVFLRHYSGWLFAGFLDISRSVWFYIFGGLWEVTLCACLLSIFWGLPRGRWRNIGIAAMLVGIIEAAQMPTCALIVRDMSLVPRGSNLCDFAAGFPVGPPILAFCIVIALGALLGKQK